MNAAPAPNAQLVTLCLEAVRLAKCAPYHRPLLQLAPRGWSCRCGAIALVCEEDSAWCADCALPVFGIDELYAVTKGYDENGDVLGAALDSFSRWAERTYDEMTDRDYCGGACLNCQERAAADDLVTYREFSTDTWYSALRTAEVLRRDGYDASHGDHGTHFVITNASEAEFQNAYAHVIGDAS